MRQVNWEHATKRLDSVIDTVFIAQAARKADSRAVNSFVVSIVEFRQQVRSEITVATWHVFVVSRLYLWTTLKMVCQLSSPLLQNKLRFSVLVLFVSKNKVKTNIDILCLVFTHTKKPKQPYARKISNAKKLSWKTQVDAFYLCGHKLSNGKLHVSSNRSIVRINIVSSISGQTGRATRTRA